jgi:FMN reductase
MPLQRTVLLIAGSPSERSRSAALLDSVASQLAVHSDARVERLNLRETPAAALLLADWTHPAIVSLISQVQRAHVIVVATPVYKAAYSGILKVFLDLLPQEAFKNKTVLPLATGGSAHHMLALDYALRPVLHALSARHILQGVYAIDSQLPLQENKTYAVGPEIAHRLEEAVSNLLFEGFRMPVAVRPAPAAFLTARCSA